MFPTEVWEFHTPMMSPRLRAETTLSWLTLKEELHIGVKMLAQSEIQSS